MENYCHVEGSILARIGFWLLLPDSWNGRLVMRGGGGYAGQQWQKGRRDTLRDEGYAIAYTDTGHDARTKPLATFAYNDREAEIDYAYRAVHLTLKLARNLIMDYYGRPAEYRYWHGCSTGGRQGLMSAQRFPEDFHGILAAAPVLNFTDTQISGLWASQQVKSSALTVDKVRRVGEAIYKACDAIDGLEDGLLRDPRDCNFDITVDFPRCEDKSDSSCLSTADVQALEAIYAGVQSKGHPYFPGQPFGAELGGYASRPPFSRSGWGLWYFHEVGQTPLLETFSTTFMRYMAFAEDNPGWQPTEFDFDRDPDRMQNIRTILDAINPDLSRFKAHGGRMITYHGWSDTALNPLMSIDYFESVAALDKDVRSFYRLYMVPGMFHCQGGRGITHLDPFENLVRWVEHNTPPDRLIGEQRNKSSQVTMTRPVCPYPASAVYQTGNTASADSFKCVMPQ